MAQFTCPTPHAQLVSPRDHLAHQSGLPFLEPLSRASVEQACRHGSHGGRERLYTPWITPSLFLSQVLSDDHSRDDAVDRFQKSRHDRGLPPVAPKTGSYREARQRLPEALARDLVRRTGLSIHQAASASWPHHGRAVKIADGSTVIMPDTPENQEAYPRAKTQAPGLGFPIARILVVFSPAVGTVLEAAVGPYQGKQASELALLRQILAQFQPGDIALADRSFRSYWTLAAWRGRGVDVVARLHQCRGADSRRGRRLGREDHLMTWPRPEPVPDWMSRAEYDAMPPRLRVRELRVRVEDKTKRVRALVVASTLLDPKTYPAGELAGLFRQRWHAELDPRSLKTEMRMEMLRTKGPEMVREEVAMHPLAYDLIRGIMAEAARAGEIEPRMISFAGSLPTVRAFEETRLHDPAWIEADLPRLLELIVKKRVGDRPDRYEPRAVKRRPKPHPPPRMPRKAAKRLIERGIIPHNKA